MALKPSEFEGVGTTQAGVRNTTELTAAERLRLSYATGQTSDPEEVVDPMLFHGAVTGEEDWS